MKMDTYLYKKAHRYIDPSIYPDPYRVHGSGSIFSFSMVLTQLNHLLDYMCAGPVQGYTIFLHTPGEVPKEPFWVPINAHIKVMLKPKMITTSEALIKYNSDR